MQPILSLAHSLAQDYLETLATRRVGATATVEQLRAALGGPLPYQGIPGEQVIREMALAADSGLIASAGPRYFGFVVGGSLPAALAAEWLAAAWDQNAALYLKAPAASVVEEVVAGWVLDLLGLPKSATVGFVTGAQMANFTCLAAARRATLLRHGWDVEDQGLEGAPPLQVFIGDAAHISILKALGMLGLGRGKARRIPTDDQGRIRPDPLEHALATAGGPVIVCAQAGEVNAGSFDPLARIAAATRKHQAWLHVDGAFGLWAAASRTRRALVDGIELADSWATDAHKWLNVPYDSGIAIVRDGAAHRGALSATAAYLLRQGDEHRDPSDYTPEASRRARGFSLYAALRALGREGVAALVDRCSELAAHAAARFRAAAEAVVLNEVVLNQVLVRFRSSSNGDDADLTRRVIAAVQRDGTCWLGGTSWRGEPAMRFSVSNWSTTLTDVERSVDAILRLAREA
jgi:glutamate/tyrosine decarboxylase-like PLP-dependent enzyme